MEEESPEETYDADEGAAPRSKKLEGSPALEDPPPPPLSEDAAVSPRANMLEGSPAPDDPLPALSDDSVLPTHLSKKLRGSHELVFLPLPDPIVEQRVRARRLSAVGRRYQRSEPREVLAGPG